MCKYLRIDSYRTPAKTAPSRARRFGDKQKRPPTAWAALCPNSLLRVSEFQGGRERDLPRHSARHAWVRIRPSAIAFARGDSRGQSTLPRRDLHPRAGRRHGARRRYRRVRLGERPEGLPREARRKLSADGEEIDPRERFLVAEALFIAAKLIRLHSGVLGCANVAEMECLLERWFTAEERAVYLPAD